MEAVWHGMGMARRRQSPSLTPEQVVDAAVGLTRERGIDGWTIRDLATELDTWPNNIAHHVGDREAVIRAVVGQVVSLMPNPPADLAWQDWFRTFLHGGAAILGEYAGVARRLCRDGPSVPAALPIIDRGVGLLSAAGFGDSAPRAYSVLLNGALLLVALDDDRELAGRRRGQASRSLLAMDPPDDAGRGWDVMRGHLEQWADDPEARRTDLLTYTVETAIAGLEVELRLLG